MYHLVARLDCLGTLLLGIFFRNNIDFGDCADIGDSLESEGQSAAHNTGDHCIGIGLG